MEDLLYPDNLQAAIVRSGHVSSRDTYKRHGEEGMFGRLIDNVYSMHDLRTRHALSLYISNYHLICDYITYNDKPYLST